MFCIRTAQLASSLLDGKGKKNPLKSISSSHRGNIWTTAPKEQSTHISHRSPQAVASLLVPDQYVPFSSLQEL